LKLYIRVVCPSCLRQLQIDLFGEISGVAFSPDGDRFFFAVADLTYSSLLEYRLADPFRRPTLGGSWWVHGIADWVPHSHVPPHGTAGQLASNEAQVALVPLACQCCCQHAACRM
jgi:hypothetical protein